MRRVGLLAGLLGLGGLLAQPALAQVQPTEAVQRAVQSFQGGDVADAVAVLKAAAEQGDASAAHTLGHLYEQGQGVSRDLPKAHGYYLKATQLSAQDLEAHFHVGTMFQNGAGVTASEEQAMRYLKPAADGGDLRAQAALSTMLFSRPTPSEQDWGMHYLRMAAQQGHPEAVRLYRTQAGLRALARPTREIIAEHMDVLKFFADQGEADAQEEFARSLVRFHQFDSAIRYFEMAQAQGVDLKGKLAEARSMKARLGPRPDLTGVHTFCYVLPSMNSKTARFSQVFHPDHDNWGEYGRQLALITSEFDSGNGMGGERGCIAPTTEVLATQQMAAAIAEQKANGGQVHQSAWPD